MNNQIQTNTFLFYLPSKTDFIFKASAENNKNKPFPVTWFGSLLMKHIRRKKCAIKEKINDM
jgi:hypothetical protein